MKKNERAFLDLVKRGVYKVYKNGKIYKCKRKISGEYRECNLTLMNTKNSCGYMSITFLLLKKMVCISTSRAIWICFNEEISKNLEVNHKNGIKTDNRLCNLEVVTRKENAIHSYKIGLNNNFGENHHNHKLKEKDVIKIKKLLKEKVSQREIAKIFKVAFTTINHINTKRSWAGLCKQ